jgi:trans-aconitate methyltransferase
LSTTRTPNESPLVPDYDEVWRNVYGDMQVHGPVHRHMRRLLRRLLRSLDYRSVVDVGCGNGENFSLLLEEGSPDRVAGIDVSAEALERARRRVPADYSASTSSSARSSSSTCRMTWKPSATCAP